MARILRASYCAPHLLVVNRPYIVMTELYEDIVALLQAVIDFIPSSFV